MAHMRNPEADIGHLEAMYAEKEHMTKEIYLLRETIKVRKNLNECILKHIKKL